MEARARREARQRGRSGAKLRERLLLALHLLLSRAGGELVAHESAIAFAVRSVHASAGRADTWREHSCIAVRSIQTIHA